MAAAPGATPPAAAARRELDEQQQPGCLLSEALYKHTVVADYVVKRHVKLFGDRFETYADPVDAPHELRAFLLDPRDRLLPASAGAIQRRRRHLRPPGVGSMTALAALRGKGATLELWSFKLEREGHHSSFGFCFAEQAQAVRWHEALSQAISNLRLAAGLSPLPSVTSAGDTALSPRQQQRGASAMTAGNGSAGTRFYSSTSAAAAAAAASVGDGGSSRGLLSSEPSVAHAGDTSDDEEGSEEEEERYNRLLHQPAGATRRSTARWVPFRHSNGLAIYHHAANASQGAAAPEYLVSAVIRGSPADVLAVLMDPASATSILGPALEVEVVDSSPGRQVLRIQIQAEGPNAAWFRPREAVVQRLLKKEGDGVYVILFSSIDGDGDGAAAGAGGGVPRVPQDEGVIELVEGTQGMRTTNPIRCRVSGGYTVSKLKGRRGADSPETLLTCVLQVQDMGGWLHPGHPLHRLVNWWSGGAYESFLERMLLAVMLVRDIVEKSRFAVRPQIFDVPTDAAAAGAGADGGGDYEGGAAPGQVPALRSSTFVMRQAAAATAATFTAGSTGGGAPFAAAAAAGASPFSGAASTPLVPPSMAHGVKISRLASHRLGSTQLSSFPLDATSLGDVEEEASFPSQQQEWDASFRLPHRFYSELHTPASEAPFSVRGPTYLTDRRKVAPGPPMFELLGMEVVDVGGAGPLPHVSRFLPSVRRSPKPYLFVYNLQVPGPPTMCCVFVFGADAHPDALGPPPDDPEDSSWEPFDFLIWRFLHGDDEERRSMFKMIPRVAEGSWVIKQSVGTTPVIIGRKLATSFLVTDKYCEVAVDVGSSSTAQYITGMVRGGAKNLVLDLGLVLEGQHPWELPEVLLGAVRVNHLDLACASTVDQSCEVPILRVPDSRQRSGATASAAAGAAASASSATSSAAAGGGGGAGSSAESAASSRAGR